MTDTTTTDLAARLAAQSAPTLQPPTDRDQAVLGWKARRAAAIREQAEAIAWRQAIRTGRMIRGGEYVVTLPADLSTSPAMAEKVGAVLDESGRETLTTTLPGDFVADPESAGRYSAPMLMAAIRSATGAAIKSARLGLTADERDDLAATLSVEAWTLAADRLGDVDPAAHRRDRQPRFGDLAGCANDPAMSVSARRAADQAWLRRLASNLIAQGADAHRADQSWRTVSTPAGWASLDAIRERPSEDGGDGSRDPADGAVSLADAIRAADDLAADSRAEDDSYLADGDRSADPLTPEGREAVEALADLTPAPLAAARHLADVVGPLANATDHLRAEGREANKGRRKEWRKSARIGAANLADLADRHPDRLARVLRALGREVADRPTGGDLAALMRRRGISATAAAPALRATLARTPIPAPAATRTPTPAPHPLDRDAILRRTRRARTARQTADDRRWSAHLPTLDLAELMAQAPGE